MDSTPTSINISELVCRERYCTRCPTTGNLLETTNDEVYGRVSTALATTEDSRSQSGGGSVLSIEKKDRFEAVMKNELFFPAGRTLANAGAGTNLVPNCIVLPINDALIDNESGYSILGTLHVAGNLQQKGSGLGFCFSDLRPKGTRTLRSRGSSSGPVSFMKIYGQTFKTIRQQGRHGANMATFHVSHPDILRFVDAKRKIYRDSHGKEKEGPLSNFNNSVLLSDEFMNSITSNDPWTTQWKGQYTLCTDKKGKIYSPNEILDRISDNIWRNGDPGCLFIDTINRHYNTLPGLGPINATNPCGEKALHPFNNCNLGSINMERMVDYSGVINWDLLRDTTHTAVEMLDSVIDHMLCGVKELDEANINNRQIGLSTMGWADFFFKRGTIYGSDDCISDILSVQSFVHQEAKKKSIEMGEIYGSFPNHVLSTYRDHPMRHSCLTTCAPTGTLCFLPKKQVNGGIEPCFCLAYNRNIGNNSVQILNNTCKQIILNDVDLSDGEKKRIICHIKSTGKASGIKGVPDYLVTADEIAPNDHISVQSAFQRCIDGTISKTVNLPNHSTRKTVRDLMITAWKKGCAGLTIYRDGSRDIQVQNVPSVCETCEM
jgi:ribonucleoside-diphosphate reductase alpha chain